MAPTLFTSCNALPPEGAVPCLGRPGAAGAPTLATACAALDVLVPEALALHAVPMCAGTSGAAARSPEGANFSRGGPVFSKSGEAKNCLPPATKFGS